MSSLQKLVLMMLALLVASVFCVVAFLARSVLLTPGSAMEVAVATPTPTGPAEPAPEPVLTFAPTWTPEPMLQETREPTATATRVVLDTATPTVTNTPVVVPTSTPDSGASSVNGNPPKRSAPNPTPTATSAPSYPFKTVASQSYSTANSFFVLYAQVKNGDSLLGGFRLVGTHQPSGLAFESAPSCYDLCKASGPRASTTPCCNTLCTPEVASLPANVQEGNVAFEAPIYETGAYYVKVVDAQGHQVSDVIEIPINAEDKQWFFYVFRMN
jgi:hypothetical protein